MPARGRSPVPEATFGEFIRTWRSADQPQIVLPGFGRLLPRRQLWQDEPYLKPRSARNPSGSPLQLDSGGNEWLAVDQQRCALKSNGGQRRCRTSKRPWRWNSCRQPDGGFTVLRPELPAANRAGPCVVPRPPGQCRRPPRRRSRRPCPPARPAPGTRPRRRTPRGGRRQPRVWNANSHLIGQQRGLPVKLNCCQRPICSHAGPWRRVVCGVCGQRSRLRGRTTRAASRTPGRLARTHSRSCNSSIRASGRWNRRGKPTRQPGRRWRRVPDRRPREPHRSRSVGRGCGQADRYRAAARRPPGRRNRVRPWGRPRHGRQARAPPDHDNHQQESDAAATPDSLPSQRRSWYEGSGHGRWRAFYDELRTAPRKFVAGNASSCSVGGIVLK